MDMTTQEAVPQTWTTELIYLPEVPEDQREAHPQIGFYDTWANYGPSHRFTPDFTAAIRSEKSWMPSEDVPVLDPEDQEAVGSKRKTCPICFGDSVRVRHKGELTGIAVLKSIECTCSMFISFWTIWNNPLRVPARFKDAGASALEPDESLALSPERQRKIYDAVFSDTSRSYFLVGPPNTGKTHLATALFRHAVARWAQDMYERHASAVAVWRISASVLLDQHVAWETRGNRPEGTTPAPYLLTSMIQSAVRQGLRPCLFLDEIDKISATEFKLSRLAQLVDAVYEAKGQLVATSNKSVAELSKKWGEDEAGTVLRRIGAGEGAVSVLFE